jgi:hypothetical protein
MRLRLPTLAITVAALTLSACGSLPDEEAVSTPVADTGQACGPVEEPPLQAGSHLIGDAEPPVPFSSTPPTSGWHASGALEVTVHGADDPLSEAEQVSILEADGAVITYRDLDDADVTALADLVGSGYDGRVALTPYDALEPGTVALTSWGTLQRCDGLDLAAVRSFLEAHVAEDVHPGH